MRIWDIFPEKLCRYHLFGEYSEQHIIWTILMENKKGFCCHYETVRWKGKLKALYNRHQKVVEEMLKCGMKHNSPLDISNAIGVDYQHVFFNTIEEKRIILKSKGCKCDI